jgi:heme exporter protein D
MMLVLQIAAGIVLALMIVVIVPLIFSAILQGFADNRRRVEKIREENEERKYAEEQEPSLKWKRRRKTLKTYVTALAAYLLGCFLLVGYIVLASEGLLPSFLQRLWDG